jgi:hypothetical protein
MIPIVEIIGKIVGRTERTAPFAVVSASGAVIAAGAAMQAVAAYSNNVELPLQGIKYQFGHIRDIGEILLSYSATAQYRLQKYPAIFLLQDFTERKGGNYSADVDCEVRLQLLIVAASAPTYRPAERYEKVFKPTLYPIYERFIEELGGSGTLIETASNGRFEHEKIDRPRISNALTEFTKGDKNLFNDHLDAIEIRNLNLRILKEC